MADAVEEPTKPNGFRDKLVDYVAGNPIKVLSTFILGSGGLMLLVYFANIGYMPDLDLQSSASLLYAVAVLGFFTFFMLAGVLVLPGLFLHGARRWHAAKNSIKWQHILSAAVTAAFFWCLTSAWLIFRNNTSDVSIDLVLTCLTVIACVASASAWGWLGHTYGFEPPKASDAPNTSEAPKGLLTLWLVGCGSLTFVLMLFPLVIILGVGGKGEWAHLDGWVVLPSLCLTLIFVAVMTSVIADAQPETLLKTTVGVGAITMVVVFLMVSNFTFLPSFVVSRLGLGGVSHARVVLTSSSCEKVNLALGYEVCSPTKDDKAPVVWCDVTIQSRMGSQVLLKAASAPAAKASSEGRYQVVVDKSELLSWGTCTGGGCSSSEGKGCLQPKASPASSPASSASALPTKPSPPSPMPSP